MGGYRGLRGLFRWKIPVNSLRGFSKGSSPEISCIDGSKCIYFTFICFFLNFSGSNQPTQQHEFPVEASAAWHNAVKRQPQSPSIWTASCFSSNHQESSGKNIENYRFYFNFWFYWKDLLPKCFASYKKKVYFNFFLIPLLVIT